MPDEPVKQIADVVTIQPWQLPIYLQQLRQHGQETVGWNRATITLAEAEERAALLSPTATIVVDGTTATIYAAEPDHSADDPALHRGPMAFVKRRPQ